MMKMRDIRELINKMVVNTILGMLILSQTALTNEVSQSFLICLKDQIQCQQIVDLHKRNMSNYPIKLITKNDCPKLAKVAGIPKAAAS